MSTPDYASIVAGFLLYNTKPGQPKPLFDINQTFFGKNRVRQLWQYSELLNINERPLVEKDGKLEYDPISQFDAMESGIAVIEHEGTNYVPFCGSRVSNFQEAKSFHVEKEFQMSKAGFAFLLLDEHQPHNTELHNYFIVTLVMMDLCMNCSYLVDLSRNFLKMEQFTPLWREKNSPLLEFCIRRKVESPEFSDMVEKIKALGTFEIMEINPFDNHYGIQQKFADAINAFYKHLKSGAPLPEKWGKNECGKMYTRAIRNEPFEKEAEIAELVQKNEDRLAIARATKYYEGVKKVVMEMITVNVRNEAINTDVGKFKKDMVEALGKDYTLVSDEYKVRLAALDTKLEAIKKAHIVEPENNDAAPSESKRAAEAAEGESDTKRSKTPDARDPSPPRSGRIMSCRN